MCYASNTAGIPGASGSVGRQTARRPLDQLVVGPAGLSSGGPSTGGSLDSAPGNERGPGLTSGTDTPVSFAPGPVQATFEEAFGSDITSGPPLLGAASAPANEGQSHLSALNALNSIPLRIGSTISANPTLVGGIDRAQGIVDTLQPGSLTASHQRLTAREGGGPGGTASAVGAGVGVVSEIYGGVWHPRGAQRIGSQVRPDPVIQSQNLGQLIPESFRELSVEQQYNTLARAGLLPAKLKLEEFRLKPSVQVQTQDSQGKNVLTVFNY